MKDDAKQCVRNVALSCLARCEHSELLLKKKLLAKGFSVQSVVETVKQLAQEGFLSNLRFCETLIAKRVRQGYGPVRIASELAHQGIEWNMIAEQLEGKEAIYLEAIQKIQEKRSSHMATHNEQRQRAYLQRRGFRLDQIKRAKT